MKVIKIVTIVTIGIIKLIRIVLFNLDVFFQILMNARIRISALAAIHVLILLDHITVSI